MARRRAERPAERGVRAETNAVAAYLTALKGGRPVQAPQSEELTAARVTGSLRILKGRVKPVGGLFGSGQGSSVEVTLREVQGWW
jgi:hypothetical protein